MFTWDSSKRACCLSCAQPVPVDTDMDFWYFVRDLWVCEAENFPNLQVGHHQQDYRRRRVPGARSHTIGFSAVFPASVYLYVRIRNTDTIRIRIRNPYVSKLFIAYLLSASTAAQRKTFDYIDIEALRTQDNNPKQNGTSTYPESAMKANIIDSPTPPESKPSSYGGNQKKTSTSNFWSWRLNLDN